MGRGMLTPYSDMRRWMFERALPWWTEHGVDRRHGGFVEQFDLAGIDTGTAYKRTRVTARQVYVFSHAALLGWKPGLEAAKHGIDHLTSCAWIGSGKHFARRTTRHGDVLDPTPDLYDHAFALFAFGWFFRATGEKSALDWAHRTLDAIEATLAHPSGLGYLNENPAVGWRQQNPHMHLTEAALAVFEASGDTRFADTARATIDLFSSKFYNAKTRTLAEFFDSNWSRAPGPTGRTIEPGHQFEWAWILGKAQKVLDLDVSDAVRGLIGFAEKYGVDSATGVTFNSVRDDGAPIDRGSRTWPNTERIKSAVALWELEGVDPRATIASSARVLFNYHLKHSPEGTWVETFDAGYRPTADKIPSSTLYHVFLAFAEALRIGKQD